jgi:hypothetical protein
VARSRHNLAVGKTWCQAPGRISPATGRGEFDPAATKILTCEWLWLRMGAALRIPISAVFCHRHRFIAPAMHGRG